LKLYSFPPAAPPAHFPDDARGETNQQEIDDPRPRMLRAANNNI
jgi:hypothetical protein